MAPLRLAAIALAAAALATGCGAPEPEVAAAPPPETLLALVSGGATSELVRVDPETLAPRPGRRVALGLHDRPRVRSPDGSRLAVGSGRAYGLRLVDVEVMRPLGEVATEGGVKALVWPMPERILVVVGGRCCPQPLAAVEIDPEERRVVARRPLGRAAVLGAAATADGLALLLGEHGRITAATLVVVAPGAAPRFVRLEGVRAGSTQDARQSPPLVRSRIPGLAVDIEGRRAFVADPGGSIVAVDLETLAQEYHAPAEERGAGVRLRDLLDPVARADGGGLSHGEVRQAAWLGEGFLAVTGVDERPGAEAGDPIVDPAGLVVVDTDDWSVRTLDPRASSAVRALAGRVVVALGWDYGVAVFEPDGRTRLRLPAQRLGGVEVAGRYGYAGLGQEYRRHRALVLDLEEGRIVSRPLVPRWMTIFGDDPPLCWC